MSLKCNTCGATISLLVYGPSKGEIEQFVKEHFGDAQPKWHRQKRKKEDKECVELAKRLLRKRDE